MNGQQRRQEEIVQAVALKAQNQPLLGGGLWFHNDIRDNYYFASYLFLCGSRITSNPSGPC